jgi:hypothetical protein
VCIDSHGALGHLAARQVWLDEIDDVAVAISTHGGYPRRAEAPTAERLGVERLWRIGRRGEREARPGQVEAVGGGRQAPVKAPAAGVRRERAGREKIGLPPQLQRETATGQCSGCVHDHFDRRRARTGHTRAYDLPVAQLYGRRRLELCLRVERVEVEDGDGPVDDVPRGPIGDRSAPLRVHLEAPLAGRLVSLGPAASGGPRRRNEHEKSHDQPRHGSWVHVGQL